MMIEERVEVKTSGTPRTRVMGDEEGAGIRFGGEPHERASHPQALPEHLRR